jgi:hypothetical protein
VRRLLPALVFVLALLMPAALPGSAVAAKAKGAKVQVRLFEFGVRRKPPFVAAGKVTFRVKAIGTDTHEFVVVRVQPGAELPTAADGSVDEEAIPTADQIGELENIKPKKVKSLTKTLEPADYVLFCNTVEEEPDGTVEVHYAKGMHRGFTAG